MVLSELEPYGPHDHVHYYVLQGSLNYYYQSSKSRRSKPWNESGKVWTVAQRNERWRTTQCRRSNCSLGRIDRSLLSVRKCSTTTTWYYRPIRTWESVWFVSLGNLLVVSGAWRLKLGYSTYDKINIEKNYIWNIFRFQVSLTMNKRNKCLLIYLI